MDDTYWLAKAARQLNASLRKIVLNVPMDPDIRAELDGDLDKVMSCLEHIDTKVIRG